MQKRIPLEMSIAFLASLTVFLGMTPFPAWPLYVTWGAAYFLQETQLVPLVKRTWPPLALGAVAGLLFNVISAWVAQVTTGLSTYGIIAGVLGLIALLVLYMEHIPVFSEGSFVFLSFAVSDALAEYQIGPIPHTLWMYCLLTLITTFAGILLAWASFQLMIPFPFRARERTTAFSPQIYLDKTKQTVFTLNEQGVLTIRDHALPNEKVIFVVDASQELPGNDLLQQEERMEDNEQDE